jgi:hypothetical protein
MSDFFTVFKAFALSKNLFFFIEIFLLKFFFVWIKKFLTAGEFCKKLSYKKINVIFLLQFGIIILLNQRLNFLSKS